MNQVTQKKNKNLNDFLNSISNKETGPISKQSSILSNFFKDKSNFRQDNDDVKATGESVKFYYLGNEDTTMASTTSPHPN